VLFAHLRPLRDDTPFLFLLVNFAHRAPDSSLTEQHRYISGLAFDVRLVPCMWLMDTDLASKLIRAVYAKA
jgi:hypothetical protein